MEDRFDILMDILENASSRTRNFLYFFMLVNFTIFVYIFGANIYQRPNERLADFVGALTCARDHLANDQKPFKDYKLDCETLRRYQIRRGYNIEQFYGISNASPPKHDNEFLDDLIKKRSSALAAAEVDSNNIQIPIIGVKIDIDYLWIVTSYVGVLGLVVITASLNREVEATAQAFRHIVKLNEDSNQIYFNLFRIKSSQLLFSAPTILSKSKTYRKKHFSDFHNITLTFVLRPTTLQKSLLYLVIVTPIITQAITIYYDFSIVEYFSPPPNSESQLKISQLQYMVQNFLEEFDRHPLITAVDYVVEIASFVVMIVLVIYFFSLSKLLKRYFSKIERVAYGRRLNCVSKFP